MDKIFNKNYFDLSKQKDKEETENTENVEKEAQKIEFLVNGVLIPEVFKNHPDVGIGVNSKQMSYGAERSKLARVMGDPKRFDSTGLYKSMGKKVGTGKMLKGILDEVYPEAIDNFDVLKNTVKSRTTHGDNITIVDERFMQEMKLSTENKLEKSQIEADAIITNMKDVPLLVLISDCLPVAFFDKKEKVVGVAHSGWRGTVKNLSGKVIEQMNKSYNSKPEDIIVYVGPYAGIGPSLNSQDSYEVGQDVYEAFSSNNLAENFPSFTKQELDDMFIPNQIKPGHYFFDQGKAIFYSLIKSGLDKNNIYISSYSTMFNNDLFTSERIEGNKERGTNVMLGVLKSK